MTLSSMNKLLIIISVPKQIFELKSNFSIAIFEEMVNKMIPYIAKVNDNKDYLTTGLLLEELNVKEFDKTKVIC